MGNTGVAFTDVWSMYNNLGALAFIHSNTVGFSYQNSFEISELSTASGVAALKFKRSAAGVNVSSFGFDQYQELTVGGNYAMQLNESFGIGVQLNYFSINYGTEGYSSIESYNVALGLYSKVNDKLSLGASAYNINYYQIDDKPEQFMPLTLRFGAAYKFSGSFNSTLEVQKMLEQKARVRMGIEYLPVSKVAIRSGFQTSPLEYSFGLGYRSEKFHIDIASMQHNVLGFSPNASMSFQF